MSSYESFTSADPSEITAKEAELVTQGLRLAGGDAWRKPERGFYVKAISSGSETNLLGPGKTTLTWKK
jgi:hypothetical protein